MVHWSAIGICNIPPKTKKALEAKKGWNASWQLQSFGCMNYAVTVLRLTGRAPPSVTPSTQSTHLTNVYMLTSLTTYSRRTNINKVHARSQLWVCRNNKCKRTQNAWHASIYIFTATTLRKYKPATKISNRTVPCHCMRQVLELSH